MPHEATLIATIAAAFVLASLFGFIASKLKMPPIIGYLVTGILIGPHTRGFVGDVGLATELADVGIILLMFGVGLHFSFEELRTVQRLVLPGAVTQIAIAVVLGALAATMWGWKLGSGIVFGLALSVSSTVVLLRALESRNLATSFNGRLAIAWLIVQDLVTVLVLVLLPPLSGALGGTSAGDARPIVMTLAITFAKGAAFVILMYFVGRRIFPRVLWAVAKTGSRELFTLSVIAAAIGVAYGSSQLFGMSFALGAFFAGMMMRESSLSHRAAEDSLPLQDAFAVLFFVSVGMLFDPSVLVRQPLAVLTALAIVMIGTPLVAASIVLAFRYPPTTAITVAAGLAQIGEFSFILAGLGVSLGLLTVEAYGVVLAAALLSIALNPIVFASLTPLSRRLGAKSEIARKLERSPDPLAELPMTVDATLLTGHVVLVGYGRVGRRISDALVEHDVPHVVVERNRQLVQQLRERGVPSVTGDASEPEVLIQGHVARACMLVIAMPDTVHVRKMVDIARMLNPRIDVVIRTHDEEEAELLRSERLGEIFMGEHELAAGMTRYVLAKRQELSEASAPLRWHDKE